MNEEVWREFPEFDVYEISSYKRVRRKDTHHIMAVYKTNRNHFHVMLTKDGYQHKRSVEKFWRLVFAEGR